MTDKTKCYHAAARIAALGIRGNDPVLTNLGYCYLDITQRHAKLLELAEASLPTSRLTVKYEEIYVLRAAIEEERKLG